MITDSNIKTEEKKFIETIAKDLSNQLTVGWFQGRMEFGPRALGSRSILCDPRSEKMQKELNLKIKFRESFRPFAPAIIREDLNNWFNLNCICCNQTSNVISSDCICDVI